MVSASRMGLLDSFGLHWAECASNNWASGPHSHFNLCTLARKMSHCLSHAHRCCGRCAVLQRLRVWLQLQRLLLSAQATFSLQRTLYCCRSNNRKCKSHKKRDPTSYEHYNRMSALMTSVITRLQCSWLKALVAMGPAIQLTCVIC